MLDTAGAHEPVSRAPAPRETNKVARPASGGLDVNGPSRRLRVCIYGGTDRQGMSTAFISAPARKILDSVPAVIVTGGFRRGKRGPRRISTDVAALKGARRYAKETGIPLKECYEAWIPEPSLDRVVRMSQKDGIALRVMTG